MKVLERCKIIVSKTNSDNKEKKVNINIKSDESEQQPYKINAYKYKSSYKLRY